MIITKQVRAIAEFMLTKKAINKRELKQVVKKLKIFNKNHTLDELDWKELKIEGRK